MEQRGVRLGDTTTLRVAFKDNGAVAIGGRCIWLVPNAGGWQESEQCSRAQTLTMTELGAWEKVAEMAAWLLAQAGAAADVIGVAKDDRRDARVKYRTDRWSRP